MVYVYFIRSGNKGNPIKIGYARNVDKRISELQIGNPQKLYLIASIPISSLKQAKDIEKWMHCRFKKQHIHGEWFYGNIKLKKVFDCIEISSK